MPLAEGPAAPEDDGEQDVARGGFSLGQRLRSPRTLVSFAIALAIAVFAFNSLKIDFAATWAYMRGANVPLYLLGFGVFYLTFPLRALRWRLLLENAGVPVRAGRKSWASLPALMEYIFLSWFANCIVPAKLGDAYRGYLLKHNGSVSFSSTFGTIFAERLLDMLALFALLVVSGWITFGGNLPPQTQLIFVSGIVLVLLILAGLVGMRWFSPWLRRIIPQRFHRIYGSFETAALRSFSPRVLPALVALTACVWLLEGFRLFFVIQALGQEGLHLNLAVIIFVALASSLLTVLPITPAGLGVVEGAVVAVLVLFAVDRNLASAVALLDRTINFWSIILLGFIAYLISKRK
ncbi:MAG: flippase-like domain-containing protein [Chloroflexales bacterium]|nr:flippase-like domain-containing protein [Chloroflexales bacterium]